MEITYGLERILMSLQASASCSPMSMGIKLAGAEARWASSWPHAAANKCRAGRTNSLVLLGSRQPEPLINPPPRRAPSTSRTSSTPLA